MKGADMAYLRRKSFVPVWVLALTWAFSVWAQAPESAGGPALNQEKLSEEQIREFLLKGKVVKARRAGKGMTNSYLLTLTDGTIVHDASFQSVDESRAAAQFSAGRTEVHFRDSYKYNIAAFELAKLLGLGDMMPVTVERKYDGRRGSLSWWLPAKMDEERRVKDRIEPPDAEAWNKQIYRMKVFGQLVYDMDRNMGNVLISEDWHVWMIDFSRAFRLHEQLENPKNLVKCDRQLLVKLKQLDAEGVINKTRGFLTNIEGTGVMKRRDRIVAHFENLIAQKGESEVLY